MTSISKAKVIAASATALLFLSLVGLIYVNDSKQSLGDQLDEAKLKSEKSLSAKLELEKELAGLKNQIKSLMGNNAKTDKMLNSLNKQLTKKEQALNRIAWDKQKTRNLEKELVEIRGIKAMLENDFAALQATVSKLQSDNERLETAAKNMKVENDNLMADNRLLKNMNTNNFRIDATKRKAEKLTVSARKTKKLMMGFDVPQDIVENVNFKIISPEGKAISSGAQGLTSMIIEDGQDLLASISPVTGKFEVSKRIEMIYKPEEKLAKGIYKIDIYNGDTYMGSCQVKLK